MMISNAIALAASNYTPDSVLTIPEGLKISVLGICVVMLELALIAVLILLMAKIIQAFTKKGKKADETAPAVASAPVSTGTPLPAGNSAGKIDLINVDEPTAAVVMAIVSNQSGIPLNRLSFKSIKLVEDK